MTRKGSSADGEELGAPLGEEFVKLFVAVKRHEIGKARAAVARGEDV